jgi:excisionase family DNA binding protein
MENLYTYKELSQKIKRAENTLRQDVMHQRIPHVKIGNQVRFRESVIEAWIDSQTVQAVQ